MKRIVSLVVSLFSIGVLSAQSIQDTVAKVGVVSTQAYSMTIDRDADLVEGAVKKRLKDVGLKVKNTDGYVASLEQVFADLSGEMVNFYVKVEEKGRRNNKYSVVTAFAMHSNLNTDPEALHQNVKAFLIDFVGYIDKYQSYLKMVDKQDELSKAERVWNQAVSDKTSIEKAIASDKQKIESKQEDIESLRRKIAECEKSINEYRVNIENNSRKLSEADKNVYDAEAKARAIEAEVEKFRQLSQ